MAHIVMIKSHICPKCQKENTGSAETVYDLIICPKCYVKFQEELQPKLMEIINDYFKPHKS